MFSTFIKKTDSRLSIAKYSISIVFFLKIGGIIAIYLFNKYADLYIVERDRSLKDGKHNIVL